MISIAVTGQGLEFDELASRFSMQLKQALIERLADIAWEFSGGVAEI